MAQDPVEVVLKEIDKEMDNFIDRVFELSQRTLIDEGKIDTGTMLKTANVNRKFLEKEIVYPALYSDVIEYGRNPGTMPPPMALNKWVRRKLNVSNETEIRNISFAIATAIKNRGIEPLQFLRNSIDKARGEFNL